MLITIMIIIGLLFIVAIAYESNKAKQERSNELVQEYVKTFHDIEDNRGNYTQVLSIELKQSDLSRLGYPSNYTGMYALVKNNDDTVHFSYPNSPDLKLINIDYNPQFTQRTSGKISGTTGSAIAGGLLLGNIGATIGASGSRKAKFTTTSQEVKNWGLLEFKQVSDNSKVSAEILLNQEQYYALKRDFLSEK